jgi:hypothetical protein
MARNVEPPALGGLASALGSASRPIACPPELRSRGRPGETPGRRVTVHLALNTAFVLGLALTYREVRRHLATPLFRPSAGTLTSCRRIVSRSSAWKRAHQESNLGPHPYQGCALAN